eukprot:171774_1
MPIQKQTRLCRCAACGNRSYYWCPVTAKCSNCYGKRRYDGSLAHSASNSNYSSSPYSSSRSSYGHSVRNTYSNHNQYSSSSSSNSNNNNGYKSYQQTNTKRPSNNKKSQSKYGLERLAPSTIDIAEMTGIYSPDQIGYLKATKKSDDKDDVQIHRGVQYTLKKGLESVGMTWSQFPYGGHNSDLLKNRHGMKYDAKSRHKKDDPENVPGLSSIMFPDDPEMAQGFKEYLNDYDGLDDIEDCFD